jgi:RimJ/RimL family protein N-acetyltransferase
MDEILTSRLRLRRARADDLEDMHAVLKDRRATLYWSTPPHDDIEQTREWLAKMIAAPPRESDDFVIEHEGRVIGKAGFFRMPDIGYILHPDYWGQGLAYEALSVLVGRAFARFPVPALKADVDPANIASQRLLEKLGFREARREKNTWFIAGKWHDSIFFELPRPAL